MAREQDESAGGAGERQRAGEAYRSVVAYGAAHAVPIGEFRGGAVLVPETELLYPVALFEAGVLEHRELRLYCAMREAQEALGFQRIAGPKALWSHVKRVSQLTAHGPERERWWAKMEALGLVQRDGRGRPRFPALGFGLHAEEALPSPALARVRERLQRWRRRGGRPGELPLGEDPRPWIELASAQVVTLLVHLAGKAGATRVPLSRRVLRWLARSRHEADALLLLSAEARGRRLCDQGQRMRLCGRLSVRRLAVLSGRHARTLHQRHRELVKAGWFRLLPAEVMRRNDWAERLHGAPFELAAAPPLLGESPRTSRKGAAARGPSRLHGAAKSSAAKPPQISAKAAAASTLLPDLNLLETSSSFTPVAPCALQIPPLRGPLDPAPPQSTEHATTETLHAAARERREKGSDLGLAVRVEERLRPRQDRGGVRLCDPSRPPRVLGHLTTGDVENPSLEVAERIRTVGAARDGFPPGEAGLLEAFRILERARAGRNPGGYVRTLLARWCEPIRLAAEAERRVQVRWQAVLCRSSTVPRVVERGGGVDSPASAAAPVPRGREKPIEPAAVPADAPPALLRVREFTPRAAAERLRAEDREAWTEIRRRLRHEIGGAAFDAWFGSARGEVSGPALILGVPDAFSVCWIAGHYGAALEEVCSGFSVQRLVVQVQAAPSAEECTGEEGRALLPTRTPGREEPASASIGSCADEAAPLEGSLVASLASLTAPPHQDARSVGSPSAAVASDPRRKGSKRRGARARPSAVQSRLRRGSRSIGRATWMRSTSLRAVASLAPSIREPRGLAVARRCTARTVEPGVARRELVPERGGGCGVRSRAARDGSTGPPSNSARETRSAPHGVGRSLAKVEKARALGFGADSLCGTRWPFSRARARRVQSGRSPPLGDRVGRR